MDSAAEGSTEGIGNRDAEVLSLGSAIRVDAAEVRRHVDEVVRGTVEQTLDALDGHYLPKTTHCRCGQSICESGTYEVLPVNWAPNRSI